MASLLLQFPKFKVNFLKYLETAQNWRLVQLGQKMAEAGTSKETKKTLAIVLGTFSSLRSTDFDK